MTEHGHDGGPPRGQWDYQSIPVRKGERVQAWLHMYRETHMLGTWEEVMESIIERIDPRWEMLPGQRADDVEMEAQGD